MLNNKYKILIIILLLPFFLINSNIALAQNGGSYNFKKDSGLDTTATQAGYNSNLKNLTPSNATSKLIEIILNFLGVIFMGLMIYGGLVWMLAEGNDQEVTKAKNIISAGIIGLIIVIAAYGISYFIVNHFSKTALIK